MAVYAADIETTGLLDDMYKQEHPKLHNICGINIETDEIVLFEGSDKSKIQAWLDEGHTFVTHNCYTYDMPALEFLGFGVSNVKWIDSLAISWYLEPERMKHGLAEYGEDFGVKKPIIENWENQTQEEYNHRVIEDCKIQKLLWQKQTKMLNTLYGDSGYERVLNYLMWKMQCLRMQQDNKWKLDVDGANKLRVLLEAEIERKVDALKEVMPKVPEYVVRKRPAKPFKMDGSLSASGENWKALTEEHKLPFEHTGDIKVVKGWNIGNPSSHVQMKAWLDGLGWEPETFKFIREDDGSTRKIPQINLKGGEICQSVKDLIPKCAGIEHIAGLGILNHRLSVVNGWLRDSVDGCITARAQGFTNTLRMQHKEYCNTPSTRVPYGSELRSLLVAREGHTLCGSDLSGVENYIKNHFQWHIDREYVKTQLSDGYCPHLSICVSAGMMSEEDAEWYKWYKKQSEHTPEFDKKFAALDAIRSVGKSTNYACQYGSGVETLARTAKVSKKAAKMLHEGYNKLNWSVPKIASMMVVKSTAFGNWQLNPVNKFWYSLRTDKDRFSTLVQGTAAYVFDIWLYQCYILAKKRRMEYKILAQSHDDQVLEFKGEIRDDIENLIRDALVNVNKTLKLNVAIKCDVMFGKNGKEIH